MLPDNRFTSTGAVPKHAITSKSLIRVRNHFNYWLYNKLLNPGFIKIINCRIVNWLSILTRFDHRISKYTNINGSDNEEASIFVEKVRVYAPYYLEKKKLKSPLNDISCRL